MTKQELKDAANGFRIRCSAISQIMTNDRSGKVMGETAKTYCQTWLKELMYGRRHEFSSKYTEKGLKVEQEAIEFAANYYGWGMVFKNEKMFENKYMTGVPDVVLTDRIPDIKSSWDCFTFPLFDSQIDKKYWWQMQGYMELTGKYKAELIYCLMSTPDEISEREINYKIMKYGGEVTDEQYKELIDYYIYENVPAEYRLKRFEIAYDYEAVMAINVRVAECRIYLNNLIDSLC